MKFYINKSPVNLACLSIIGVKTEGRVNREVTYSSLSTYKLYMNEVYGAAFQMLFPKWNQYFYFQKAA